jgi:hypothetical protein
VDPKFDRKLADLEARLLSQPGALDPAIRSAAAQGDAVPGPVADYVEKVRRHANTVTDEDVEALRRTGYSDDQIFELTVAAAYGAARARLDAAMAAMMAVGAQPNVASTPEETRP